MPESEFETQLRSLDQITTLVRRRYDRETWRFQHNCKLYFLHFYPGDTQPLRGSAAAAEFAGLKTLQDFKVPAVRAAALLSGYRFGTRKGDAVITHGLKEAIRLDVIPSLGTPGEGRVRVFSAIARDSPQPDALGPHPNPLPDSRERGRHSVIRDRLTDLLQTLGKAGLGHRALRLSSFLWHDGAVYFADAVGVSLSGLKIDHLMNLANDAGDLATRADRVRAWRKLVPAADVPPPDKRLGRRFGQTLDDQAIEPIAIGDWQGRFQTRASRPAEWSVASRLSISPEDWQREWPRLLELIRADGLEILKRDPSGDVLATTLTLADVPIDVVVKRPRNKFWYRYVYDCFRPSRAMRLWQKARWLQVRHIAVEYPLLIMERKRYGYAIEAVAVFERVPGTALDALELNELSVDERYTLFSRCGRILRRIEDTSLAHTDAKSSNWIIFEKTTPVLIDAYGLRPLNAFLQLFGIRRLLRSMRQHPDYTPTDSRHICQGFAPRAPLEAEDVA